jgi:hypothetical protein
MLLQERFNPITTIHPDKLNYKKLAADAGIDIDAPKHTATLPPYSPNHQGQLGNDVTSSLNYPRVPLHRNQPNTNEHNNAIQYINSSNDTTSTDITSTLENDKNSSNVISANWIQADTLGMNVEDIGLSLSETPGEVNNRLGYSYFQTDGQYHLLPNKFYNNLDNYKSHSTPTINKQELAQSIIDKLPKTILQKDFDGISNIFAPNFIFLGQASDYNIDF